MSIRILVFIFVVFTANVKGQTYSYILQADLSLLVGKEVRPVPGIQIFNGVDIGDKNLEAGITVGVDIYRQFKLLPVSASLRWKPWAQKQITPYIALNAGYGLAWLNRKTDERDYRGGVVLNPLVGFRLKARTKTKLNFGFGFKHQRAVIIEKKFDDLGRTVSELNERYKIGRISLNFGVGF